MDISELLGNPEFKMNITIGKVLKIIKDLIDGKETSQNISKKYKVDQLFVEQIGKYVICIKDNNHYQVKSFRGTPFRMQATSILKEYLKKDSH